MECTYHFVLLIAGVAVPRPLKELWRDIPSYKYYQASTFGRIRRKAGTPHCVKNRVLRPRIRKADRVGRVAYRDVHLQEDCVSSYQTVHKLVSLTWHGLPPGPGYEVAHIDDNPGHNWPDNLEWVTSKRNKALGLEHGRIQVGEKHYAAKLSNDEAVQALRMVASGVSVAVTARHFSIKTGDIRNLIYGRSYKHLTL